MSKRILRTGLILVLLAAGVPHFAAADPEPPSAEEIAFAETTSDLLLNEVLAALLQVFSETTPANVEETSTALSLLFDDAISTFRLVGELDPLSDNSRPQGDFEEDALALALDGGQASESLERVQGRWFLRRSIPLSNFDASCALCHTNFGPVDATDWVGSLMLKVPVPDDDEDSDSDSDSD